MVLSFKLDGTDWLEIENYIKHKDIFWLFSMDTDPDDWKLDNSIYNFWIGFYRNKQIKGAIRVERRPNAYLQFHPYMHPKDREYKFKMIEIFEQWVRTKTEIGKLVVEFPTFFGNLEKFAIACGYIQQGYNTRAFKLGTKYYDTIQYGKEVHHG